MAALLAPQADNIQKLAEAPDCLLGEVTQPGESLLMRACFTLAIVPILRNSEIPVQHDHVRCFLNPRSTI